MSEKTNGSGESADEKASQVDIALDQYERPFGVPPLVGNDGVSDEARRLLDLPPAELRALTPVQCAEGAFILGQYAHRLQNAANREAARVRWAQESITKTVAREVPNYRGYSYDERRAQAVLDNDHAVALDRIRVKSQLRLDRVAYLAARASDLVKALLQIKHAKQGNRSE